MMTGPFESWILEYGGIFFTCSVLIGVLLPYLVAFSYLSVDPGNLFVNLFFVYELRIFFVGFKEYQCFVSELPFYEICESLVYVSFAFVCCYGAVEKR